MAYDRIGTGPWAWLKAVGSQQEPLEPDWRGRNAYLLTQCFFAKHPRSLRQGDLLVYYAARWGCCPALLELVSDEVDDDVRPHPTFGSRWRWKMAVRPIIALPLTTAPSLADAGIDPLRVRRQSHILLTRGEYETLRDLLLERAIRDVDGGAEEQ